MLLIYSGNVSYEAPPLVLLLAARSHSPARRCITSKGCPRLIENSLEKHSQVAQSSPLPATSSLSNASWLKLLHTRGTTLEHSYLNTLLQQAAFQHFSHSSLYLKHTFSQTLLPPFTSLHSLVPQLVSLRPDSFQHLSVFLPPSHPFSLSPTMQFESPNFHFDVDDTFSLCSQPMSCPSTANSFSSSSSSASLYDPFTPTSRRSTPHELITMEFDGSVHSHARRVELTPPSTLGSNSSPKYVLAGTPVVKTEPDQQNNHQQVGFPNSMPGTPMKREPVAFDYMEAVLHHSSPMGSLTPSNSFNMYAISPEGSTAAMGGHTPFIMTPTHSLSGSEPPDTASSTWSCTNDSPISFFPHKENMPSNYEVLEIERSSLSPYRVSHHHHHHHHDGDANSPNRMRAQRKMLVHEAQRKSHELQRVAEFPPARTPLRSNSGSNSAGRKRGPKATTPPSSSLNVVQRSPCRCDYPNCTKVFRRNEHLKRHKQT